MKTKKKTILTWFAHWIGPVLILVVGAGISVGLMKTSPRTTRTPPKREARLVETLPIALSTATTTVHAMGTVMPSTEVELMPRVSGEIVEMAPELMPGGSVAAGQVLLKIDPADYLLAHSRAKSDVAAVQSDLAVEKGRQAVAEQEFDMLGMEMSEEERDRVLRKPQLDKLRATLATMEAQLEQAELNLARAEVKAPFNAVVRDRYVNIGGQVSMSTKLATVVGTDEFWIEVTVPVRELRWIQTPRGNADAGAGVRIYNDTAWAPGTVRTGKVVRLLSELEPQGRMARLLIAVDDPLSLESEQPPLLLGQYVRVEIEGRDLEKVAVLKRSLIRDTDKVWVLTGDSKLEIREVEIAYESRDTVYVNRGVVDGDHIIVTDLSSPVDGMPLRTAQDGPGEPPTGERSEGGAGKRP